MRNTAEQVYDFELFEEENKHANKRDERIKLKLIKKEQHIQAKQKKMAARLIIVMCAVLALGCSGYLYEKAQYDILLRQKNEIQTNVESIKSDNIRIKAQIDASLSIDNVNEYAINELGMIKAERWQIYFVDMSEGDRVVKYNTHQSFFEFIDNLINHAE